MPNAMLAADPAAADLQVVGEEGQRDLVELLDDEGVGEAAPEGHQVVGRDGPGDRDLHGGNLPRTCTSAGDIGGREGPADVGPTGASREQWIS